MFNCFQIHSISIFWFMSSRLLTFSAHTPTSCVDCNYEILSFGALESSLTRVNIMRAHHWTQSRVNWMFQKLNEPHYPSCAVWCDTLLVGTFRSRKVFSNFHLKLERVSDCMSSINRAVTTIKTESLQTGTQALLLQFPACSSLFPAPRRTGWIQKEGSIKYNLIKPPSSCPPECSVLHTLPN